MPEKRSQKARRVAEKIMFRLGAVRPIPTEERLDLLFRYGPQAERRKMRDSWLVVGGIGLAVTILLLLAS